MEVLRRENAVISSARFSPDGRFIAYSEGPMNSSKVFVLPSQGGEPRLVSSDATFVDWTRDGRYLAINSGNPDSRALYLLPVKDGQSAGEPVFIRNGSIDWGKTTADGSLFYAAFPPPDAAVSLGTIDPEGHPVNWKRLNLMTGINVFPEPKWSMDSSQIAYLAINVQAGQGGFTVRLRNIASGEDRELYRAATAAPLCVWAAHDTKLYCGEAGRSSTEILSVSVDSGHVERLASLPGMFDVLRIAPDDSALYLGAMKVTGIQWNSVSLVRWQIATHRQTALGDGKDISPDERWVWGEDSASGPQTDPAFRYAIRLRPVIGADWRPVGKLSPRANATHPEQLDFTTDGNWLYFHDSDSSGKDGLFRAPTAGGQPVRMGDFPSHSFLGTIKISPDGRKIIVNTPESELNHPELWLLANFVPKQQAAR
jgi:Tol biopolymer transport system component